MAGQRMEVSINIESPKVEWCLPVNKKYYVYILRCSDGTYYTYTGTTQDLKHRIKAHNDGRAANYTALRRPVKLVFSEVHPNIKAAISRERQIKRWTRSKKEALISGNINVLKKLSKKPSQSKSI